ncbi:MAG TPA: hypothetical protein VKA50_05145 [Gammaproteobacteria bacterium]|nr:hypothetical protein [Gammaproteobacteria bacterium]
MGRMSFRWAFMVSVIIGVGALLGCAARAGQRPAPTRLAGMMGRGMMGGAMGGEGSARAPDSTAGSSAREPQGAEQALLHYISDQRLSCLRCHAVDAQRFGPSFRAMARSAGAAPDAATRLSDRIAEGVGRMPPGLATRVQARRLARLILELGADPVSGSAQ